MTHCTANSVNPVGPHTHTKHLESSGLSRKVFSIQASIRPLLPFHESVGSDRTYSTSNLRYMTVRMLPNDSMN